MIRILAWMMLGAGVGMLVAGAVSGRRIFTYRIRAARLEARIWIVLREAGIMPRPNGERSRHPDNLELELLRLAEALKDQSWREARP